MEGRIGKGRNKEQKAEFLSDETILFGFASYVLAYSGLEGRKNGYARGIHDAMCAEIKSSLAADKSFEEASIAGLLAAARLSLPAIFTVSSYYEDDTYLGNEAFVLVKDRIGAVTEEGLA